MEEAEILHDLSEGMQKELSRRIAASVEKVLVAWMTNHLTLKTKIVWDHENETSGFETTIEYKP